MDRGREKGVGHLFAIQTQGKAVPCRSKVTSVKDLRLKYAAFVPDTVSRRNDEAATIIGDSLPLEIAWRGDVKLIHLTSFVQNEDFWNLGSCFTRNMPLNRSLYDPNHLSCNATRSCLRRSEINGYFGFATNSFKRSVSSR